jgi:hypothetical protein
MIKNLEKKELDQIRYNYRITLDEQSIFIDEPGKIGNRDSLSVVFAVSHLKSLEYMKKQLRKAIGKRPRRYHDGSIPAVEIVDKHGQNVIPDMLVQVFTETMVPEKTIFYGPEEAHKSILVPNWIWQLFVEEALDWWIESGEAPEHLALLRLERDLGL